MAPLARAASIDDLRAIARRRLPRAIFDFLDGGAEDDAAVRRNRAAFERIGLMPRYLRDVAAIDPSITVFGRRWDLPVGIAPTGLSSIIWPGADLARARLAAERNIPFVLSTASSESIEEVAAVARGQTWFQLYAMKDRAITTDLMQRAASAGIEVLMVTVDTPVSARRDRDIRNGFDVPFKPSPDMLLDALCRPHWSLAMLRQGRPRFGNMIPYTSLAKGPSLTAEEFVAARNGMSLTWGDIDRLRNQWSGKLVLKGLMSPADIALAADRGADGVVVSNHGGRQLGASFAPIEVLSGAVDAARSRIDVMLDSGIRRGADIIKAVTLGARFVFVGRAPLYGLAAGGCGGLAMVFDILEDELRRTMAQLGCVGLLELSIAAP